MSKPRAKMPPARIVPQPPASLWPRLWPYALLAALSLLLYGNMLVNGFVSDDNFQLVGNPLVTDWRQLPQIFQHHIWAFAGQSTSNYYRPIQTLVYLILYSMFGFSAPAFHVFQLTIHAANAMLVYAIGRRLLASRDAALVAGILFAVHPIHDEAVVWIAVVPDALVTLVVLTALLLFIRWQARPSAPQIALLSALFLLALLTKEPGAMLLPLLLGYEFLGLGRTLGDLWRNRALYASMLAVFGLYCVLRVHALGGMAPAQDTYYHLHGSELLFSVTATLGQYLGKLVVPIHLSYYYFFEPVTGFNLKVALSLLAAAAIVAGIILLRRWQPVISYGLFLIVLPLAPALNLNGVGESAFAERYLYLPSVGLVLAAAVLWQWLATKQRAAAYVTVAVTMLASTTEVILRNPDWRDDERLYTVSSAQAPKAGSLVADLGWLHYLHGEYEPAIERYRQAIQLQPSIPNFHANLSSALSKSGRHSEAISELHTAIQLDPKFALAHLNLGLELQATGDRAGAAAEYQTAASLDPHYAEPLNALASMRLNDHDSAGAFDLLNRAIAANPRHPESYVTLGLAYNDVGNYAEASVAFRKAIEVDPEHPTVYLAHYDLGIVYMRLNSLDAAALEFAQALQRKPDYAPARTALDRIRAASGRR